mmetsp:Transcript_22423/g.48717  ORF Transcript_22423/g.48717 Transcript_22423/m.48717 type:complete len:229 (+) Transcript_22423:1979-2665(+)
MYLLYYLNELNSAQCSIFSVHMQSLALSLLPDTLLDHVAQLSTFRHTQYNITSPHELPTNIKLGNRWPLGILLHPVSDAGIVQNIDGRKVHTLLLKDADYTGREAAHGHAGRALHVKHDGVGGDVIVYHGLGCRVVIVVGRCLALRREVGMRIIVAGGEERGGGGGVRVGADPAASYGSSNGTRRGKEAAAAPSGGLTAGDLSEERNCNARTHLLIHLVISGAPQVIS